MSVWHSRAPGGSPASGAGGAAACPAPYPKPSPASGAGGAAACPALYPTSPLAAAPPCCLLRVARDGNPLRAHGWACSAFGKLAPVDAGAADALAEALVARLQAAAPLAPSQRVLVLGLAESSLLPAWWVAQRLAAAGCAPGLELALSTRTDPQGASSASGGARWLAFQEAHSHAPQHFIALPPGVFERLLVVEDELTTGKTLACLLAAVLAALPAPAPRVDVLALLDLRADGAATGAAAALGVSVHTHALATAAGTAAAPGALAALPLSAPQLPLEGLPSPAAAAAAAAAAAPLHELWRRSGSGERCCPGGAAVRAALAASGARHVLAVGEAVAAPLAAAVAEAASGGAPASMRHVTRSPWAVDGGAIRQRHAFAPRARDERAAAAASAAAPYYIYNFEPREECGGGGGGLLVVHTRAEAAVAEAVLAWLQAEGVSQAAALCLP